LIQNQNKSTMKTPNQISSLLLFFVACLFILSCQSETSTTTKTAAAKVTPPSTIPVGPNVLSDGEKADGWVLLFDGTSTDQWRSYGKESFPETGWFVEEGMLVIDPAKGAAGDIITKEKFENFVLKLDYQVSEMGNSGIFYRVLEEDGQAIWASSPEFQILDNKGYIAEEGKEAMFKHLAGENYDLHGNANDYANATNEWNEARLMIKNNKVEHWLNGNKVVEYELESPEWRALVDASKFKDFTHYGTTRLGHIGLQDHGNLIKFRNIKIKKL